MEQVKRWEGCRLQAYWDVSRYSIGYGTISHKNEVISQQEATERMLKHANRVFYVLLPQLFPNNPLYTSGRRIALALMIYQLGYGGVSKFKNMIKSIKEDDWSSAAFHASDSNWRVQTPSRAQWTCKVLFEGEIK